MYCVSLWHLLVACGACLRSASGQVEIGSEEEKYEFPKIGQLPYVAYVSSKAGVCTGTIVNEDWVLTAAHCFYFKGKVIGGGDAKVMAGVIDYDMPQQFSKQESASQEIHVHPRFWLSRLAKFDVALVKVRDRLVFNDWVTNIEISGEEWPQPVTQMNTDLGTVGMVNDTLNCMWAGFGGYATTAIASTKLKQRNVTALHGEGACTCTKRFQEKRLVCVKDTLHAMTCRGDDGGPLVCDNIVRAIVHMVSSRSGCEKPTHPLEKCYGGADRGLTSFMFLCPLNDWLHSVVDQIPPKPASCRAPSDSLPRFALLLLCACATALATSLPFSFI